MRHESLNITMKQHKHSTSFHKCTRSVVFKSATALLLLPALFTMSGCFKSDAEVCIEEQSHLWNKEGKTKADNQVYWSAIAECKANNK
ncbi:MAG: hypothetical protein GXO35_02230 [Gammaproteobacteria bacterium]|nr:hypothetical protein [Gammaproteobacteria bacterium]